MSAQAFIGQSPALTSRPKSTVTNPNAAAVLQVPRGRPLGLRLTIVELISGRLSWGAALWRIRLVSAVVIRLAYLVFCD